MVKIIVLINKMEYLILLNTIAFITLMIELLFFLNTEHKLKACLFNPTERYCYTTDLKCPQDSDIEQDPQSI